MDIINLSLDINVTTAQGLVNGKNWLKKRVYAVVSLVGKGCHSSSFVQRQRTCVGKYLGKTVLTWDSPSMRFHFEETQMHQNNLVLIIQLRSLGCARLLSQDKVVGEVHVPLKQLYDNCGYTEETTLGAQDIIEPTSGKTRGFLDFSYKFGLANVDEGFSVIDHPLDESILLATNNTLFTPSAPYAPWC